MQENTHIVRIKAENADQRLDIFLAKELHLSRNAVHKIITSGKVSIAEIICLKPSARIEENQKIVVMLDSLAREDQKLVPTYVPLDIVFEDDDVIVINKPANMLVHPSPGRVKKVTLVEAVLYHVKGQLAHTQEGVGPLRPGVVHRLDAETTGLIVFAKNSESLHGLMRQFQTKIARRFYAALLMGVLPKKQFIEAYFYRNPQYRTRYLAITPEQLESGTHKYQDVKLRWAKSYFEPREIFKDKLSLVEVELFTGRTHQVRLHAKMLGVPVLGDKVYGSKDFSKFRAFSPDLQERMKNLPNQLLHAYRLQFIHPRKNTLKQFQVGFPATFLEVLSALRADL